ncbi:hypothetical protein CR203_16085 [Salipaludibacillus neizhouensis]|uniref:Metal-dependent hydrolase n=1 Tax=Salipaludibacillus neizhouensis TaxID=885475 RepID=A0A3A9K240_9BACI|nr:metal-dependent hydrolase [Salipaludibacillus neizhouensis]RKL66409.1 hypothetical protein CR203_16085 [Salipaludibacillus neizhouensis]
MRYYTHITTSLSAAVLLTTYSPLNIPVESTVTVTGLLLGAVLPDIDETRSWLGRRVPVLSGIIKFLFGHRGLTHSGLVLALMGFLLVNTESQFLVGLSAGVILHIIEDSFSRGGIPLLYPFTSKRTGIPLYRTGGLNELLIFAASLGFLVYSFM